MECNAKMTENSLILTITVVIKPLSKAFMELTIYSYPLLKKIQYISVLRSINAKIEIIDQFTNNFSQNALVANENYDVNNFFSVQIRFVCEDFNSLTELLSIVPQSASGYFQLSKNYIFLPEEGLDDDENIYTLKISMNPACFTTKQQYRKSLNIYLLEIKKAIDSFYNFDQ